MKQELLTVGQLIEQLKDVPSDYLVEISDYSRSYCFSEIVINDERKEVSIGGYC